MASGWTGWFASPTVPPSLAGAPIWSSASFERDGNGALDALVVDYLAQAQKLATVPMSVAPLESWLEAIA